MECDDSRGKNRTYESYMTRRLIHLQEQIHYLDTTTDEGSKRKDFRFAH